MTIHRAKTGTSTTLDQTSWTQVDSMTLTPGAGDYLAVFTMECRYNSSPGSEFVMVGIYVNGVQQTHSLREVQQNSNVPDMAVGICATCYVSPGAAQVVEVKYIASAATNPMTGHNRELILFPAPGTNYQDTDTVNDTIASPTWTTLDSMTRTPAAGTYLLVFSTYCTTPNNEIVTFRVSVGGTPILHTRRWSMKEASESPSVDCVLIACSISPNGSQVVEIEWRRDTGSGTQTCYHRNMILIGISSDAISEASGTAIDTDSTMDAKQYDDMLIISLSSTDFLAIFSSTQKYGALESPGAGTDYITYLSGVPVANSNREFYHHYTVEYCMKSTFSAARVSVSLGAVALYWQGLSTYERSGYERTLIVVKEVTYKLEGVTYDKDEVILGSVDCYLYKDNQDNTITFMDHVVSHATTGAYSFTGIGDNNATYFIVFIKDDSPHVFDVTDHVLQPVV